MSNWNSYFKDRLSQLAEIGQQRSLQNIAIDQDFINLCHNDYLAIVEDPPLGIIQDEQQLLNELTITKSSSASRLLAGYHQAHHNLEHYLEQQYHKSALIFNSGYHANLGILAALGKDYLIIADKQVHASLIDGIKLSQADFKRFAHNDYQQLARIVKQQLNNYSKILIVVETLYSMDGDFADLDALINLKKSYPQQIMLYLDEAHAVGVFGEHGLGLSDYPHYWSEIDIYVAPCGKALAANGALVLTNSLIKNYLINYCRTLIYATALAPSVIIWLHAVIINLPRLRARSQQLIKQSNYLKQQLTNLGYQLLGQAQIISVLLGTNHAAQQCAQYLMQHNIQAALIRPPTVAQGTARLRISVNYKLTQQQLDLIVKVFADFKAL